MSITEVARLSGFSHATVSRVLNNRAGVSEAAEHAVRRAIEELGYRPSERRRGRKPKPAAGLANRTIALLMMRTDAMLVRAPVTAAVLHGVEKALADADINLVVGQVQDDGRLPPSVEDAKVDGLLLHGFLPTRKITEKLARIPSVWLLSPREPVGYFGSRVSPDNESIGRLAAEYLIEQGHKRIAYLYCEPGHQGFSLRKAAFEHVARRAGVECVTLDEGPMQDEDSRHATVDRFAPIVDKLLAMMPRPTGVFVPRDRATVLVHKLLIQRGVDLSSDLQLVSCDNDPVLSGLSPLPATIDINTDLIGREAVSLLTRQIERQDDAPLRHVVLVEPRLIRPEEHSTFVPVPVTRPAVDGVRPS
ncbi:MAG: LacI family DNA-binding transcriptional regulator [Planctomycetota bacterium]